MRAALALALTVAALCTGCSRDPSDRYDEYPGRNGDIDLRGGAYDVNAGYVALPMSNPMPVTTTTVPDRPWVEHSPEVNPVHPGVTPVTPSRLAALLPKPPEGWSTDEPNGVTLSTSLGSLTEASRMYWKKGAVRTGPTPDGRDLFPSVSVTLVDRGQTGPEAATPDDEVRGGTLKSVEVEGLKGHEFVAGPALRQIEIDSVAGRYLVRVRGAHVSSDELRAWVAKIPLKELAAL